MFQDDKRRVEILSVIPKIKSVVLGLREKKSVVFSLEKYFNENNIDDTTQIEEYIKKQIKSFVESAKPS